MARKKILWLCSWYPGRTEPFNGDFIQRHAMAAALYNDIHVIHVIGDASGIIQHTQQEMNKSDGLTEQIIYFKKTASFFGRIRSQFTWTKLFRKAIQQYIKDQGRPQLVHVQVPMKAGIPALWMQRKYKVPFIITEHWGIYNDVAEDRYPLRSNAFKYYTKKVFENAAGFISVSTFLGEGVNRMVVKKQYEVIPNVVDTSLFYYKEKPFTRFRFIHVSNMVSLKNAEGILRAFKILVEKRGDVELIMVGNTDDRLRVYANSIGLSDKQVLFRGEVPYEQVAKEMQEAGCLILFSNIENSPCVIGEALCCGLPVIATNTGGIPELVNAANAVLITPKDEEALAAEMQRMTSDYGAYDRKKIAEHASGKFSYPVAGKKMDYLYSAFTPKW